MAGNKKTELLICAAFIAAGIILIVAGMNPFRALYLILFGVFLIISKKFDFEHKETPKGFKFWWKKVLSNILSVIASFSLCNFLLSISTDSLKDVIIWAIACLAGGILFGTFDYFAHTVDCSVEEFEARKKSDQEFGEQYDKVIEEMKSEKAE